MINRVFIHGRISQDLDVKTSQNDKKIVRFGIAVRNDYKSQSGEYESQFFNCVAFGNQAEFLSKYFKKGQEVLILGHLQNNSWQTENGEKRTSTNIVVETAEFCGNKVVETAEFCGNKVEETAEFCGNKVEETAEFCGNKVEEKKEENTLSENFDDSLPF